MKKDIPVYQIVIDEVENMIVDCVSIVEHPAIERNFLAFNNQEKNTVKTAKYKFSDEDKMQLLGVAMVPDEPIYRRDDVDGEYYVEFSKDEIETIVKVFMKKGLTKSMNVEHKANQNANSFIFQSFIVDDKIKAPEILGDVPVGSWIIGVQVEDKDLWKEIKDGKRNGFSIEGLFKLLETNKTIKEDDIKINIDGWMDDISDDELESIFNTYSNYLKYINSKNS